MDPKLIRISGAELRPGDKIYHPTRKPEGEPQWRHVNTVVKQPEVRPGSWSLSCECRDAAGAKTRISIGPTEQMDVERKGKS